MKKRAAIQKPESSRDFIKGFSPLDARLRGMMNYSMKKLDKNSYLPIIRIVIAPRPTRRKARTGLFFLRRGYAH